MPVLYDGKKIIPAPFVEIQKQLERKPDGRISRKYFTLALKGKLIAFMGSPDSTGAF